LLAKYAGTSNIQLDKEDRDELGCLFLTDLGMNPATFPIKIP